MTATPYDAVVVGAGYTGLAAAFTLAKAGKTVCVVEADETPGGLAGTFRFSDGVVIEKFYHHWFNNDVFVPELVREIGHEEDIITLPSRNGMYFNGRIWNLSTPLDLIRFTPLSLFERIRLGSLVFRVRSVKDWKQIEHLSVREWLEPMVGEKVYRVVWEPLISAKFSQYADDVSAAWFWKKLALRGSTRNSKGAEELAYFRGGFGRLADLIVAEVEKMGGTFLFNQPVTGVKAEQGKVTAVKLGDREVAGRQFVFTPAFPLIANIFDGVAAADWLERLRRVHYLANMCLVLRLDRSLSDTYWLNVNDPGFPFVGVIEHTNFDSPENYAGSKIAYLSRYLPVEDPVWSYTDDDYADFALVHLKRMFPEFDRSWILDYRVWRTQYGQPVTERDYSRYVPKSETPFDNALIATMAQVYPEDRGTNYAIREGRKVARQVLDRLAAGGAD